MKEVFRKFTYFTLVLAVSTSTVCTVSAVAQDVVLDKSDGANNNGPLSLTPPVTPPANQSPSVVNTGESIKVAAPTSLVIPATMPWGPNTIADIAQAVAPSVVSIDVDQKMQQISLPDNPGNFFEFFFNGRKVPGGHGGIVPMPGLPGLPGFHGQNMGSGFIIRPNGYILTNAHVVKGADKISVNLADGRRISGTVIGTDSFTDIALVKIAAENLPVVRLGSNKGLRPGEFVIAIGSPLGYDHTVTFGIISAIERDVRNVNEHVRFIQTDAAINPGNSGGPLLNLAGDVIGINTAIRADAQNLGFSIPIDTVKDVIEALIAHKKIERPYLGIVMEPVNETHLKSMGLPNNTTGVFISKVNPGPAQVAGVTQSDIVQKIDGKNVTTPREIQDIVHAHKVGDTLHLLVLRQGQAKAVVCDVGQYPDGSAPGERPSNQPSNQDE
jgi:S1-C subfamily serine protease